MSSADFKRFGPVIYLFSPVFVSTIVYLFSFACIFFPRNLYEQIVEEDNFMFFDIKLLIYVLMCWLFFILGNACYNKLFIASRNNTISHQNRFDNYKLLLVFIFIAIVVNTYSISSVIATISYDTILYTLIGATSASNLRVDVADATSSMHLGWVAPFSFAILIFAIWAFCCQHGQLQRTDKLGKLLTYILIVLYLATSLLTFSRGNLLTFIFFIFVIKALSLWHKGTLTISKVISVSTIFIILCFLVFAIVQIFRVNTDEAIALQFVYYEIVRYFVSAYNRLSVIIDGKLSLPSSGCSYYTNQWFWDLPVISKWFQLRDIYASLFGTIIPPSASDDWMLQFDSVSKSGLNGWFIWVTVFGYAFSDYGWFSIIWFFLYGLISAMFWNQFLERTIWGIVLYPYILLSIAFWNGGSVLVGSVNFEIMCFTVLIIWFFCQIYNQFFQFIKLDY